MIAAGRWSLVAPMREPIPAPTEIACARVQQLLDRYGILTRETARSEGIEGGFAGVYPLLRVLEERGEIRRGYFVAGLGAAQFAAPGAVDRIRSLRVGGVAGGVDAGLGSAGASRCPVVPGVDSESEGVDAGLGSAGASRCPVVPGVDSESEGVDAGLGSAGASRCPVVPGVDSESEGVDAGLGSAGASRCPVVPGVDSESEGVDAGLGSAGAEDGSPIVLAATDPAQPYGAVLPWPESSGRPVRAVGAYVVIHDGVCVAELERGGRALVTFPAAHHSDAWIPALQDLVISGRLLAIEIAKVDGVAVRETPWAARVQSAGFSPGYRGMTFRP